MDFLKTWISITIVLVSATFTLLAYGESRFATKDMFLLVIGRLDRIETKLDAWLLQKAR